MASRLTPPRIREVHAGRIARTPPMPSPHGRPSPVAHVGDVSDKNQIHDRRSSKKCSERVGGVNEIPGRLVDSNPCTGSVTSG